MELLVKVTSRAWALTILALLDGGTPGRQAPLVAASGASRTAFRQSMLHLIDLGLAQRTSGHGHPLRPEFTLTRPGRTAAETASRVLDLIDEPGGRALLRKAWTLPVLAVTGEAGEFGTIKSRLWPITDRALSEALKSLEKQGWIARTIREDTRPPKPVYKAVGLGARLQAILAPS